MKVSEALGGGIVVDSASIETLESVAFNLGGRIDADCSFEASCARLGW